jgi:Tol biopolymer transport system component
VLIVVLLLALPVGSASAAFPGANGKIAYGCGGQICLINPDGNGRTQLTPSDGAPRNTPAWSPDGTKIAFQSVGGSGGGVFHIWVMNADGSGSRQVSTGGDDSNPSWSPGGTQIAYQRNGQGIWVANADGTNQHAVAAGANSEPA